MSDSGFNGAITAEVIVVTSTLCTWGAAPVAGWPARSSALINKGVGACGVWGAELGIHTIEWHVVGHSVLVSASVTGTEVSSSPTTLGKVERTAHLWIISVHDSIICFILVPPIWKTISVLIGVKTVCE